MNSPADTRLFRPLPSRLRAKFPGFYGPHNTIMLDDLRRNFLMNPQNGLKIRPYVHYHRNRETDQELPRIGAYLDAIAALPAEDFQQLDHRRWEEYVRRAERRAGAHADQGRPRGRGRGHGSGGAPGSGSDSASS